MKADAIRDKMVEMGMIQDSPREASVRSLSVVAKPRLKSLSNFSRRMSSLLPSSMLDDEGGRRCSRARSIVGAGARIFQKRDSSVCVDSPSEARKKSLSARRQSRVAPEGQSDRDSRNGGARLAQRRSLCGECGRQGSGALGNGGATTATEYGSEASAAAIGGIGGGKRVSLDADGNNLDRSGSSDKKSPASSLNSSVCRGSGERERRRRARTSRTLSESEDFDLQTEVDKVTQCLERNLSFHSEEGVAAQSRRRRSSVPNPFKKILIGIRTRGMPRAWRRVQAPQASQGSGGGDALAGAKDELAESGSE